MPKSKRTRILPTSQTKKNRKELARRLHANIQAAADTFPYIWVFDVQNVRNNFIKDVRQRLGLDSRIFMGKTKIMAHALGATKETEYLPGLATMAAEHLKGEVGLLFTMKKPEEVEGWFEGYVELDYARAGAVAEHGFVVPRGELTTKYGVEGGVEDPVPMSVEPTLRKLGVPTRIVKGKVVLEEMGEDGMDDDLEGYVVCRAGEVLDSRQTSILKIFGVRMAEFRIVLKAVYDKKEESVRGVGQMEVDETVG